MSGVGEEDVVADLRAENAALRTEMADIRGQLTAALKLIADLRREVAELREKQGQNSQNSSRAPSTDTQSARDNRPKMKTGRKRGGQPGHKGHERMLLPVDKKNVRDVKPEHCKGCGSKLEGEDQNPYRHQVVELPEPKPEVREARLHELECKCCGTKTRAALPADFSRGGYGPRLVTTIALLSGQFRLSKRVDPEFVTRSLGGATLIDFTRASYRSRYAGAPVQLSRTEALVHELFHLREYRAGSVDLTHLQSEEFTQQYIRLRGP